MSNKGPETFFFVYRKSRSEIDIIHGVLKMDYHAEVTTVRGKTGIQGSRGVFCNTIDEAFLVENNFDELMDDDLLVEDFTPKGNLIPEENLLEIEEKEIHNGIKVFIEEEILLEDLSEREKTPGNGEIQDPSIPMQ